MHPPSLDPSLKGRWFTFLQNEMRAFKKVGCKIENIFHCLISDETFDDDDYLREHVNEKNRTGRQQRVFMWS